MRTLTLGLAVALIPACFYVEVINVAPQAAIERLEVSAPVMPGGKLKLTGRRSSDPDGDVLQYEWKGRQGGPTISSSGVPDFELQVTGHEPIAVELTVRDPHGAFSTANLIVEVANGLAILRQPVLSGSRNEENRFIYSLPVGITAEAVDPDGDPIVSYTFSVRPPPGSVPAAMRFERTGFASYELLPDVHGTYEVTIVARDAYAAGLPYTVTIDVAPDGPPYIAAMQPPWSLEARVILLRSAGPRDFVVTDVVDDLDPHPGSENAHFRWWVRLPGGLLAEVAGHDSAALAIDPGDLAAGDLLEVRVEVADRRDRPLPCATTQAACSLTNDDRYQRITWTVEVR